ncbi:hypothetical protein STENM327S_00295 [Streptomyces tendae]
MAAIWNPMTEALRMSSSYASIVPPPELKATRRPPGARARTAGLREFSSDPVKDDVDGIAPGIVPVQYDLVGTQAAEGIASLPALLTAATTREAPPAFAYCRARVPTVAAAVTRTASWGRGRPAS